MELSLENIARDLAFEIQLGGLRFDSDDLKGMLYGIPASDLKIFRERTLLHARDFAPDEPMYASFAERSVDSWLSVVDTAEDIGRKPVRSWYEGVKLTYDKGKFFAFNDGSIRECSQCTVEAAWGPDARKGIIMEMTPKQVARHYAGLLLSKYGKTDGDDVSLEFCSCGMLPEGRVTSIERRGDVIGFNLTDSPVAGFVSFDEVFEAHPSLVTDLVYHELDERVYIEVREADTHRQDLMDFKARGSELIDRAGERVRADFLYDQVLLESNPRGSVYLRREVDDLKDRSALHLYIFTSTPSGSTVSVVSEDFDAGTLSRLSDSVENQLASLDAREMSSVADDCIVLNDGPYFAVPGAVSGSFGVMKAERLVKDDDGVLFVVGSVDYSGKTEQNVSVAVSELSDKAVRSLREASDQVLSLAVSRQPRPEVNHKQAAAPARKVTEIVR